MELTGVLKLKRHLDIRLLQKRTVCLAFGNVADACSEWVSITFDQLLLDCCDFYRMFLFVERCNFVFQRLLKEVPRIRTNEIGHGEEVFSLISIP